MKEWELRQRQSLPLEAKINLSKRRIREWYEHWDGDVYISFSGGKDSTVLLDLVRSLYPDVPAVFVDTGLEFPEIKEQVRLFDNVTWVRPKMPFTKVIEKYGYPVIGKEQSHYIYQAKYGKSEKVKQKVVHGIMPDGTETKFKISKKWLYLIDAPFMISDSCCSVMKKSPVKKYEKATGRKAIIGTMAEESVMRLTKYLKTGCNAFDNNRPVSMPLSVWTEQDVLRYIRDRGLQYASVYGEIIENHGMLYTTGENRTGCMFCMYGVHLEKGENRFQRMSQTHPKQYDYCINKLGLGVVLDYIGVDYRPHNLFAEVQQ